jgi:hypothetical protein
MQRSFEWLKLRKKELAYMLQTELRREFNLRGLSVAHGITRNAKGELDFSFSIEDLNDTGRPGEAIAEFARKKLAVWEPEATPKVLCAGPVKG